MDAWAVYSAFLRDVEKAGASVESIRAFEARYDKDISSTWYEVLRVGRSYGAEFND